MEEKYSLQENGNITASEIPEDYFIWNNGCFVAGESITKCIDTKHWKSVENNFYRVIGKGQKVLLEPIKEDKLLKDITSRFRKLMGQREYENFIGSTGNIPQSPLSELDGLV